MFSLTLVLRSEKKASSPLDPSTLTKDGTTCYLLALSLHFSSGLSADLSVDKPCGDKAIEFRKTSSFTACSSWSRPASVMLINHLRPGQARVMLGAAAVRHASRSTHEVSQPLFHWLSSLHVGIPPRRQHTKPRPFSPPSAASSEAATANSKISHHATPRSFDKLKGAPPPPFEDRVGRFVSRKASTRVKEEAEAEGEGKGAARGKGKAATAARGERCGEGKGGVAKFGFPKKASPEVCLVGRSNVGKSSLLNALIYGNSGEGDEKRGRGTTPKGYKLGVGKKARVSARPGETVELGFYNLKDYDKALTLVDCPGYGFNVRSDER